VHEKPLVVSVAGANPLRLKQVRPPPNRQSETTESVALQEPPTTQQHSSFAKIPCFTAAGATL
jgi:hypothetical protein